MVSYFTSTNPTYVKIVTFAAWKSKGDNGKSLKVTLIWMETKAVLWGDQNNPKEFDAKSFEKEIKLLFSLVLLKFIVFQGDKNYVHLKSIR